MEAGQVGEAIEEGGGSCHRLKVEALTLAAVFKPRPIASTFQEGRQSSDEKRMRFYIAEIVVSSSRRSGGGSLYARTAGRAGGERSGHY